MRAPIREPMQFLARCPVNGLLTLNVALDQVLNPEMLAKDAGGGDISRDW
jgi:hypothetical protein